MMPRSRPTSRSWPRSRAGRRPPWLRSRAPNHHQDFADVEAEIEGFALAASAAKGGEPNVATAAVG
eukprot:2921069-Pyramimonas_sp.AAC.1